jgi:hypothetical protein
MAMSYENYAGGKRGNAAAARIVATDLVRGAGNTRPRGPEVSANHLTSKLQNVMNYLPGHDGNITAPNSVLGK